MSSLMLLVIAVAGIALLVIISLLAKKSPRRINKQRFQQKWLELLAMVKTPEGMVLAVISADKMLDEALRCHHYKGKTMGERLVAAQRALSDNDAVWFAHKLRNRLVHEPDVKLRQNEAKKALAGFRQSLKDLGAM